MFTEIPLHNKNCVQNCVSDDSEELFIPNASITPTWGRKKTFTKY